MCVLSVTELAREQPLDGSVTNMKSSDPSTVISAANSDVLPSADILNSLDMIQSWLQQPATQSDTVTHTSINPTDTPLPVPTSSWHTAPADISTVWHFYFIYVHF